MRLRDFFTRTKAPEAPKPSLECCEGVAGMWHYHLRRPGTYTSLCGKPVMNTGRPLSRWNVKIPNHHIPESFCKACDGLGASDLKAA